jgi:hypothetical protein
LKDLRGLILTLMLFRKCLVNVNRCRYKDKIREKQRQEKLKRTAEGKMTKREGDKLNRVNDKKNNGNKKGAWSNHAEQKEKRLQRSEKKTKKRIAVLQAKQDEVRLQEKKKLDDKADWEDLQRDTKRIKRGEDFDDL